MSALTSHWVLDPSLIYVSLAAVLYWVGGNRDGAGGAAFRSASARTQTEERQLQLRELSFAAGLLTIVIALCSPIEHYADELFWVHMGQHILLLTVAPPLILLGRPWPRMWRAIPLGTRTPVGRGLARSDVARPLRWLTHPAPAWVLFNGDLLLWHLPKLYNLTLEHQWVHNAEHTCFFFTGLLFWAHVVDSGPLRSRLAWPVRCAYLAGAMVVGWMLAIGLVIDPYVLYSHYAHLLNRPENISAISDQQIAGGMMWVPGSISYTIGLLYAFSRWAGPEAQVPSRRTAVIT